MQLELTPHGISCLVKCERISHPLTLVVISVSPGGFTHISDGTFFLTVIILAPVDRGDLLAVTAWTRKSQCDLILVTEFIMVQKNSSLARNSRLVIHAGRRDSICESAVPRTPLTDEGPVPREPIKLKAISKSKDSLRPSYALMTDTSAHIRGRAISVSPIRQSKNGKTRFLTVELVDTTGNEHRLVFFNEAAEKAATDIINETVYALTGGTRKGIEILYYKYPVVEKRANDPRIPSSKFVETTKIADLMKTPLSGGQFNVLAVVINVGTLQEVSGGHVIRKLGLVDDSLGQMTLTLWDDRAKNLHVVGTLGAVVTATKCYLREFREERALQIGIDGDLRVQAEHPLLRRVKVGSLLKIVRTGAVVINGCVECAAETVTISNGNWLCQNSHEHPSFRIQFNISASFSFHGGAEVFSLPDRVAAKLLNMEASDFALVDEGEKTEIFRSISNRRFVVLVHNKVHIVDMRPLVVH